MKEQEKIWDLIRRRAQGLFDGLVELVRGRRRGTSNAAQPEAEAREELVKTFSNQKNSHVVFDPENRNLEKLGRLADSFRSRGYRAGLWGLREENINRIAEMETLLVKSEIEEACDTGQRKLTSRVKMLKSVKDNAQKDYEGENSHYKRTNRRYQYNPREFSPFLGFIYAFFSAALFLADIPLALELIRQGFNLPSDGHHLISQLFRVNGGPEHFVFNFFQVLAANWEIVFYAAGVAFCTIYFKIFYDDYVAGPLENLIKRSPEAPKEDFERLQDDCQERADKGDMVREVKARFEHLSRIRRRIKIGLLSLLFISILVLGYFRYSVASVDGEKRTIADVTHSFSGFLTYCCLTILFPLISGVCASLSLNCFHNWREKARAERKNAAAQNRLGEATKEFQEKEAEMLRNDDFMAWLKNADTVRRLNEYMVACYDFGFKFGYLHPKSMFGGDLFTRAEAALRHHELMNSSRAPASPVLSEDTTITEGGVQ
jgi:hypothetical protein